MNWTGKSAVCASALHCLTDWQLVGVIVLCFSLGYLCAVVGFRDDILH
jgi:hypothetical protein